MGIVDRIRKFIICRLNNLYMEEQPTESTCGETCVAYIVGTTVSDIVAVIGKKKRYVWDRLKKSIKSL